MAKSLDAQTQEILRASRIDGNALFFPGQLPRDAYLRVDKVLRSLGGKWDRRAGAHLFPFPANDLVAPAAEVGAYTDRKQELQFFETPEPLSRRLCDTAEIFLDDEVLEPSAGHGRLALAARARGAVVVAVEIDHHNCAILRDHGIEAIEADFIEYAPSVTQRFDAVVMNPPFVKGQDVAHVRAAFGLLRSGGRLAAIMGEGVFFRADRAATESRARLAEVGGTSEPLPAGTFHDSGTDVATRLVTIRHR
jgi:predicted RNA methylase